MRVFTEDVKEILEKAISEYDTTRRNKEPFSKAKNKSKYFEAFTQHINSYHEVNLKPDTVYKQYYIRVKTHDEPVLGCSLSYLNIITAYAHQTKGMQYLHVYKSAEEDEQFVNFPYTIPSSPASYIYPLSWFKREDTRLKDVVVLDESENPTGTHHDRLSWHVYLYCDREQKKMLSKKGGSLQIPTFSMISSGNSAIAIQKVLRLKGLSQLRVIVDNTVGDDMIDILRKIGCFVVQDDVVNGKYDTKKVLHKTDNPNGKDLTAFGESNDVIRGAYDSLGYEALNLNPSFLFCPVGSGLLFGDIVNLALGEFSSANPSQSFRASKSILKDCMYFGASAPLAPFEEKEQAKDYDKVLRTYYSKPEDALNHDKQAAFHTDNLHDDSKILPVKTSYLKDAKSIFDSCSLNAELSACAGLALFLELKDQDMQKPEDEQIFKSNKKVVIINTGKLKTELF